MNIPKIHEVVEKMNIYEERMKRMEEMKKRNEAVRKENEKKLKHVLKQIENEEYRKRWERVCRADRRFFKTWTYKIKEEMETLGNAATTHTGMLIGTDMENKTVTFLVNWDKGLREAMKERKLWMPDGKVVTYKLDDLIVLWKRDLASYRLGH